MRRPSRVIALAAIPLLLGMACHGDGGSGDSGDTDTSSTVSASTRADLTVPADTIIADTAGVLAPAGDGSASVDDRGQAHVRIPIWVPPGRAGMQPELSLEYTSGAGNGLVGVGWGLAGLARISRCPSMRKNGNIAPPILWNEGDTWCADGDVLVPSSDGRWRFRRFHDDGSVFVWQRLDVGDAGFWQQYTRDGRIYSYGSTGDSKVVVNPHVTPSAVMSYALSRVEDRAGNFMTVTYTASAGGEILPGRIDYTGSAADPTTHRSVTFRYGTRKDVDKKVFAGIVFTYPDLLTSIEMRAPNTANLDPLRTFNLTYGTGQATQRSLLTNVAECDGPAPAAPPAPGSTPLCRQQTFDYTDGASLDQGNAYGIATFDATGKPIDDVSSATVEYVKPWVGLLDVNGDGLDDLLYLSNDAAKTYHLRFATGSTFGPAVETNIAISYSPDVLQTTAAPPIVLDFDGDGHADVLVNQGATSHLYLANKVSGSWMLGGPGHEQDLWPNDLYVNYQSADLNGDARPDLIMRKGPNAYYSLNTNGTFSGLTPPTALPSQSVYYEIGLTNYFMDFNNDGVTDLMTRMWDDPTCATDPKTRDYKCDCSKMHYGALDIQPWLYPDYVGTPPTNATTVGLRYCTAITNHVTHYEHLFGDFNGDGSVDTIEMYTPSTEADPEQPTTMLLMLGDGNRGFIEQYGSGEFQLPYGEYSFQTLDADGDGAADLLVRSYGKNPYTLYSWKNGLGKWVAQQLPLTEDPLTLADAQGAFATGDANGDGLTDFVAVTGSGALSLYTRYTGNRADMLSNTHGDFVRSTDVRYWAYRISAIEDRSDCQLPLSCVTRAGWLVSEVLADNGAGAMNTQSHSYGGGRADTQGWGFLGFKTHKIIDARSGTETTRSFQFPASYAGPTPFYPYAGLPYEIDTSTDYQSDTQTVTRLTRTSQSYTTKGAGPFMALPNVIETQTTDSNADTPIAAKTTTFDYDDYGNEKTRVEWFPVEDEHRTTTTTYLNDPTTLILGRPTYVSVTSTLSSGTSQTRETAYTYDALGQLAVQIDNPGAANSSGSYDPLPAQDDGVQTLYTKYTRDGDGQPILVEKLDNLSSPVQRRATQYRYDTAENMFVIQITDPVGLITQRAYEPGLGVVAASADAGNVLTTYQYDTFGRIRFEHAAAGDDRVVVYNAPTTGNSGIIEDHRRGHYMTTTTLDSLRRTIATKTTGRADGQAVYVYTTYDALGRTHTVSRPKFAGAALANTTTTYDALGRVTRIDGADGSVTTTSYLGNQVTTTNPDGNVSRVTNDSLGRPVSSVQATTTGPGGLAGHVTTTTLAYGPFDTQISSTDTLGNAVTSYYDRLGRLLWKRDRDSGATAHSYNVFGEISDDIRGARIKTVVFGGKVRFLVTGGTDTHMTYDDDGRVTTKATPDITQTFAYDTAMPGKLSGLTLTNGTPISYTYDRFGNVATKTWSGPRGAIGYAYAYDQYNRLVTTTYPKLSNGTRSLILRNTYSGDDVGGQLTSVDDITIFPTSYWKLVATDASETFPVVDLHNGVESTLGEDPMHPGWLNTIVSTQGTPTVQSLRYTREGGGRVHMREDLTAPTAPITETFGYDGLERLTSWTWSGAAGARGVRYDYDDIGNLRQRTITAGPGTSVTYNYSPSFGAHQVASDSSGTSYQYDERGNQLAGPGHTFTWSTFDRPLTVTSSGTYTMTYDAELARFSRTTPAGGRRYSYGGLFEELTDGGITRAVMTIEVGGKPVGEIEKVIGSNRVAYTQAANALLTDALGSIDTIVTTSGVDRAKYDPFGTRVTASDPTVRIAAAPDDLRAGFTGHEHDDDVNLIDMIGRVYDPVQQRFLSIDPPAPDPVDSQAYNPYAYVRNNPLNATDPTGYLEIRGSSLGLSPNAGLMWNETDTFMQWITVYSIPYGALPGEVQGSSGTAGPGTPSATASDGQLDLSKVRMWAQNGELCAPGEADESKDAQDASPAATTTHDIPNGFRFGYVSGSLNTPLGSLALQVARNGELVMQYPTFVALSTDFVKYLTSLQVELGVSAAVGFVPAELTDKQLVDDFMSGDSITIGAAAGLGLNIVSTGPLKGIEVTVGPPGIAASTSHGTHVTAFQEWWGAITSGLYNMYAAPP